MKNKQAKRAVNEVISLSHAEFAGGAPRTSASSMHVVTQGKQQRKALKILNIYQTPDKNLPGRGQAVKAAVQNDTLFNDDGFTLIELLVVVLIIGILAAVALPQYQKAVEKSRATQAITLLKTLAAAQEVYRMENGEYASRFEDLAVDIPWTGNTLFMSHATDTKSNSDWSVQIKNPSGWVNIHIARIAGKYKGAGFSWIFETGSGARKNEILCFERTANANILFDANLPAGAYCQKLFGGTLGAGDSGRYYSLP